MNFLRDISWDDVFSGWRDREANNPGWIRVATEVKGWSDWESWRRYTAEQLNASSRAWKLYAFADPMNEVPAMLLGPYTGWQSRVENKLEATFDQLFESETQRQEFLQNTNIQNMMDALPFETQFIGLKLPNGKIMCVDGHHRATAITLAKKQGHVIDYTAASITIAIAELSEEEVKMFGEILQKGSSKP
ncbi:MAG: hypothetical protein U0487_01160 [Patescibacteria group bacterium]